MQAGAVERVVFRALRQVLDCVQDTAGVELDDRAEHRPGFQQPLARGVVARGEPDAQGDERGLIRLGLGVERPGEPDTAVPDPSNLQTSPFAQGVRMWVGIQSRPRARPAIGPACVPGCG